MPAPSPMYGVSVDQVALVAATAKTAIELTTLATKGLAPVMWWVEFDGVSASALPVKIEVGIFSAAVTTATTVTPFNLNGGDRGAASIATAKHSTTVEGAGTATYVETHRVSPTSGILVQEPLGNEVVVGASSFWRIRLTAAANVNVTCGVRWF